jgi:hypothetical protein
MKGTISPSSPACANASRISAKPAAPVWCVMWMGRPALRNSGQLWSAAWFRVRLGLNAEEFFAHGESGDFGAAAGKERRGLLEGDEGAGDEAGDGAVGESRYGVGLHHDYRDAAENGGQDGRPGDVAAHAEDGRGVADTAIAADGGDGQTAERGEGLAQADAVESADLDLLQLEAGGGDQLGFQAMLGTDKGDVVAAGAQFAGYGKARDYVPASASSGH